jgi:hypothetical protein
VDSFGTVTREPMKFRFQDGAFVRIKPGSGRATSPFVTEFVPFGVRNGGSARDVQAKAGLKYLNPQTTMPEA